MDYRREDPRGSTATVSADSGAHTLADYLTLSSARAYVAAAILGIIVVLGMFRNVVISPMSEFAGFYIGARLAGTPYLYDKAHNREEQARTVHVYNDSLSYVRLPFYATLLSPIAKLPYRTALYLWQALSLSAAVLFVFLWPHRGIALVACAWSLPLAMVFMYGEDDNFLLVFLAMALVLYRKRPFSAGALMSLLGIKFNLFLLLPLLLLGQKRWRMATGFLAGCTVLLAISFGVGGIDWPLRMIPIITQRSVLSHEYIMPNLRGLLQGLTSLLWPELALGALVAGLVFLTARRSDFELGMAAMLVGSLLVSHHAGPEDCVVLLPALLLLGDRLTGSRAIYFCITFLSPIPYYFLVSGGVAGVVAKLAIVALLGLISWRARPWLRLLALRQHGQLRPADGVE